MQWVLYIWPMAVNLLSRFPHSDAFGSNTRSAEPWQEKPEVPIATWVMKWAGGAPPLGALQEPLGLLLKPQAELSSIVSTRRNRRFCLCKCVNASSCWMSQSRMREKNGFAPETRVGKKGSGEEQAGLHPSMHLYWWNSSKEACCTLYAARWRGLKRTHIWLPIPG